MIPAATISQSARTGAPARKAATARAATSGEKARRSATSTIPQACTIRTATSATSGGNRARAASRRTIAKLSA